jgi:aspartyl aminopeptidase
LGMHAPLEIASKGDIYETHKAYKAFMENNWWKYLQGIL